MSEIDLSKYTRLDHQQSECPISSLFRSDFISHHFTELKCMQWASAYNIPLKEFSLIHYNPKSHVVIFDLDDTLVHSTDDGNVVVRPYTMEVLDVLSAKYELWLWSAADREHLNHVFSLTDSFSSYFSKVFDRSYCTMITTDIYLKHIGSFANINLCNVIAVDDNLISYAKDVDNFLFIDRFDGSCTDDELLGLEAIIDAIFQEGDARIGLQKLCNFKEYLFMLPD